MKKKLKNKNLIISILSVTIIILVICFVVLMFNLDKDDEDLKYEVLFNEVTLVNSTKGGLYEPSSNVEIIGDGMELDLDFKLHEAHDEVTYNVIIKNRGNVKCEIVDLIETPNFSGDFKDNISPVTIKYSDAIGKVIDAHDTYNLKITVTYNPSLITGDKSFSYKLGLITKQV